MKNVDFLKNKNWLTVTKDCLDTIDKTGTTYKILEICVFGLQESISLWMQIHFVMCMKFQAVLRPCTTDITKNNPDTIGNTTEDYIQGVSNKRWSNFDVLLGVQYLTYRNNSCVAGTTRLLASVCRRYCKIWRKTKQIQMQ